MHVAELRWRAGQFQTNCITLKQPCAGPFILMQIWGEWENELRLSRADVENHEAWNRIRIEHANTVQAIVTAPASTSACKRCMCCTYIPMCPNHQSTRLGLSEPMRRDARPIGNQRRPASSRVKGFVTTCCSACGRNTDVHIRIHQIEWKRPNLVQGPSTLGHSGQPAGALTSSHRVRRAQ